MLTTKNKRKTTAEKSQFKINWTSECDIILNSYIPENIGCLSEFKIKI